MSNYKLKHVPESVAELRDVELMLVCLNSGIGYNVKNLAVLDEYMRIVFRLCQENGIEQSVPMLRVLLGDVLFAGNEIRNLAVNELVQKSLIKPTDLDREFKTNLRELGAIFNQALFSVEEKDFKFFDELTRETFIIHATMLMHDASQLRKRILNDDKYEPELILAKFADYIKNAQIEFALLKKTA